MIPHYRKISSDKPNYIFRGISTRFGTRSFTRSHIDSVLPSSSVFPTGLTAAFILEDHTKTNGCTVVVPKSHRSDRFADRNIITDLVPGGKFRRHDYLGYPVVARNLPILTSGVVYHFLAFTSWHLKQPFQHCETIPNYIYQNSQMRKKHYWLFAQFLLEKRLKLNRMENSVMMY